MIKSAYILCLYILISLLSSCASNPHPVTNTLEMESLDQIIFNKARSAFKSGNFKTAVTLFEPLADNGNADAQYTMGYLYYHGKGVDRNLVKAMEWFTLSAKQGQLDAITAISLIKTATKNKADKGQPAATNAVPVTGQGSNKRLIDLRRSSVGISAPESKQSPVSPVAVIKTRSDHPQTVSIIYDTLPKPLSDPAIEPPAKQAGQYTFHVSGEEESNRWINNQLPGSFTIQLASNTRKEPILKYISHVALDGVYYFRSQIENITRYHVIHGSFQDFSQAKRKLKRLQQRGFKNAWIRNTDAIKKIISQSGK
ncbi:MAG TPA: hypothetical protein ENI65_04005 [Gammaproteobacteria bacterium]|nr:hypothetical protein [Gammaproteobacteria bacterium]